MASIVKEEAVKTVQPEPVSQPTETVTVVEEVEETLPVTESVEVATHTEETEQLVASTMTEPEEEVEVPPPQPQVDLKAFLEVSLERFVKALHVYERYENVTSNPLPDNVSYFGKTLLGLTSISSFQETVNNSLRTATFYLDVSGTFYFDCYTVCFLRLALLDTAMLFDDWLFACLELFALKTHRL